VAARKTIRPSDPKKKSTKGKPVIIEPSQKTAAEKSTPKPDMIEARAVDVTPTKPSPRVKGEKKSAEKTAEKTRQEPQAKKPKPQSSAPKNPAKSQNAAPKKDSPAPRSGGFWRGFFGSVLGGVLAVLVGYLGAEYLQPNPNDQAQKLALVQQDLNTRLVKLDARLKRLENQKTSNEISRLHNKLNVISAQVEQQDKRLKDLRSKIKNIKQTIDKTTINTTQNRGIQLDGTTRDMIQRFGAEIDALKARLNAETTRLDGVAKMASTQLTRARTKVVELSKTARNAARNIDLTQSRERLRAAVETGKAYQDVLAKLASEAAVDIPDALRIPAKTGVVPLVTLQQQFAPAARRALKASIQAEAANKGLSQKFWAFLKAQVGARSLSPKAGKDPDAILSRAEAALNEGDLAKAVALVETLPPAGVAAMSDWLHAARTRLAAKAALTQFYSALGRGK